MANPKTLYLVAYNLASAIGWAWVLQLVIQSYTTNTPLWEKAGFALKIVQTANGLELLHSLIGLVPSPFVTTFSQLASRLILLWVYSAEIVDAQNHWSLFLMMGSWSLVEVPRYLFYALNLLKSAPYPLFFLRYSLFMVLYPSGITGEVLQIVSSLPYLKKECVSAWYISLFLLVLYIPGGPFMYKHMLIQRKKASQKLNQGPVVENGLVFPMTKRGERSTQAAGKATFAASIRPVNVSAAEKVEREKDWRFGYAPHVVQNVKLSGKDAETCLKVARAGLSHLHNTFEFVRDGKTTSLAEAMHTIKGSFKTHSIKGSRSLDKSAFNVPYKGRRLTGAELVAQLDKWVQYGTIEKSSGDAIKLVAENPEFTDLSSKYFVLLGAGSMMGPLQVLLSLGANIVAVDLDREGIWSRLIKLARDSPGSITFPVKSDVSSGESDADIAKKSGCNLFTQTPEIANWIKTVAPGEPLTIGSYAYLDGALHVQVSLAMDAIAASVCAERKNTALAYLCSPTDVFVRDREAHEASIKNAASAPAWQKFVPGLVKSIEPEIASEPDNLYLINGLVVAQGPNYALAKRLQHWRAMVARSEGHPVSSNIAPSTSTPSVVHNKQFAAAYGGMHLFKPMEIMAPETSNAVMGALLVHDIVNKKSAAYPSTNIGHPLRLFGFGAFHGGVWRCGFTMNSLGLYAALAFYAKTYGVTVASGLVAVASFGVYAAKNIAPPHTW